MVGICSTAECNGQLYTYELCKHCYDKRYRATKVYKSEYDAWANAKQRCRNRNREEWDQYGGRGITFSPLWDNFKRFLEDVGPRPSPQHTLDRIDVDGNYEPGNVRWATRDVQVNNQRIAELEQEVELLKAEVERLKKLVGE